VTVVDTLLLVLLADVAGCRNKRRAGLTLTVLVDVIHTIVFFLLPFCNHRCGYTMVSVYASARNAT